MWLNEEFCDLQDEINREAKKEKLNESLKLIGISPTYGLAKSEKINIGCGKLEQSILKVASMTKGDATFQWCFQNCTIPKDLKHLRYYDMDCQYPLDKEWCNRILEYLKFENWDDITTYFLMNIQKPKN